MLNLKLIKDTTRLHKRCNKEQDSMNFILLIPLKKFRHQRFSFLKEVNTND